MHWKVLHENNLDLTFSNRRLNYERTKKGYARISVLEILTSSYAILHIPASNGWREKPSALSVTERFRFWLDFNNWKIYWNYLQEPPEKLPWLACRSMSRGPHSFLWILPLFSTFHRIFKYFALSVLRRIHFANVSVLGKYTWPQLLNKRVNLRHLIAFTKGRWVHYQLPLRSLSLSLSLALSRCRGNFTLPENWNDHLIFVDFPSTLVICISRTMAQWFRHLFND